MIFLIIPCYNEQEVLRDSAAHLQQCLTDIPDTVRLLFVDDGSRDGTWQIIEDQAAQYRNVEGIRLSHNRGQQVATWAGMEYCAKEADAVICIDADLQDDINVLPRMVEDFHKGYDVVYGVRDDRSSDSRLKKYPAWAFYKTMKMMGCELVENHSEFRLLSRRAMLALLSYPERNLFVRCMVPMLGFNATSVYYSRQARRAGKTKYSTLKLLRLALDGITSFSVRAIRWIQLMGVCCILFSFGVIGWALLNYVTGRTTQGWPSLLISTWFLSGVKLIALGIIGEYVAKIYTEVKRRPRYFIMDRTENSMH